MKNHILDEVTIGSAKVIVDILPKGKVIPGTVIKPTSITIHNTGNIGAPAKNNHNYMKNCNKDGSRMASWHFTCDDKEIYQAVPANNKAWHAGHATGNNTSIGIEIAMFNDAERQKKAYLNAIELVKILMKYYGFTTNDIKQHWHWTRKDCPTWLRSGKFGYDWPWFIHQLGQPTNSSNNKEEGGQFLVKIITDTLNIRTGSGTNNPIVGQVHKGEVYTIVKVRNNWGLLKSCKGWISLNSKYVKKV